MRHLPLAWLQSTDAGLARACGDAWLAACPGVPSVSRPALAIDLTYLRGRDGHSGQTRIWYPSQVSQLDGASFREAPNWRVCLPYTVAQIRRNALLMKNCTEYLADRALEGSAYLVIVHDPTGRRFNVSVTRQGRRFIVDQVNSWANGGEEPSWIRGAFQARLDERDEREPPKCQQDPQKRPTTHRDRRRARARASRQLRR
jgi:hypothetical protein